MVEWLRGSRFSSQATSSTTPRTASPQFSGFFELTVVDPDAFVTTPQAAAVVAADSGPDAEWMRCQIGRGEGSKSI